MAKKENVSETCEVNYLHFPGEKRPDCPNDKYVPMSEAMEMLGASRQKIVDMMRNGDMDEVMVDKYPPADYSFRQSDLVDLRIKFRLSAEDKRKQ